MKVGIFFLLSAIISLTLQAQPSVAEKSTICTTTSSLSKIGNELVISISIDITRDLLPNESIELIPTLNDSLKHYLKLPSIYINSPKQHIVFKRDTRYKGENIQALKRKNGSKQTLHYLQAVPFEKWMNQANLSLTEKSCGCGIPNEGTFTCIARMHPQEAYIPQLAFVTPQVETSKIRYEKGCAYIDFPINDTAIHKTFSNNTKELEKIAQTIHIIKADTNVAITHIYIYGYASPDGPYKLNESLSKSRTKSLKKYVCQLYDFKQSVIQTTSYAEDWEGFEALLEDTIFPKKTELMNLLESDIHPDQKEAKLKKQFAELYQYAVKHWFPILRHSDYVVEYHVRPFTVEEARNVFETNPKNLSLEEIFRLTLTYTPGSDMYNKIFMTAVSLHPDNPIANLNAACIALTQKDLNAAAQFLEKSAEVPEKLLAQGVFHLLQNNLEEAEQLLIQAKAAGLTQADANLKIIQELK